MSGLTPSTMRDETFEMFTDKFDTWIAQNFAVELRYQGKIVPAIPAGYWARLSLQQVQSTLKAFATNDDGPDNQVFETSGLAFVMVYAPMSAANAFANGDLIATAARNILRSANTPSGCWFRNARYSEMPSDGQNYVWKVVAEYEFDEKG